MPGRPVLAAVFNCRSQPRACSRPFVRDFHAWGPSSISTRDTADGAKMVEPAGQNLRVDGAADRSSGVEPRRAEGNDLAIHYSARLGA